MSPLERLGLNHRADMAHADGQIRKNIPNVDGVAAFKRSVFKPAAIRGPVMQALGRGATRDDAILDGRRLISQRLASQISSETQIYESDSSNGIEHDTTVRIHSSSSFEHAELIQTASVKREGKNFVAVVELDVNRAIDVYMNKVQKIDHRLDSLAIILEEGAKNDDTAVLMKADLSPRHLLRQKEHYGRVLRVLGQGIELNIPPPLAAAERRASRRRKIARIRIKVAGNAPTSVRQLVLAEMHKMLSRRGCLVERSTDKDASGPVAVAHVLISSRDHFELGVVWRYLGFRIQLHDHKTNSVFFSLNALPEVLHGGGPNWARADQAVMEELQTALKGDLGSRFEHLNCLSL